MANTKRIINWGIIGAGHIAGKFAADLAFVDDAKLVAIASTDVNRAQKFADKFSIPNAYGTYEGILSCPNLDVVYVATTNDRHCPNTLMCLENGIAVLCEKPFAMNTKEVQSMIDKAREKKVFLMEALWSRFVPGFKKIKVILDSGELGAPILVKADFGAYVPFEAEHRAYNPKFGGGSLVDIGIYPIFLAQTIFGKPTAMKVTGMMNPITGVDDTCLMQTEYENGGKGFLSSSFTAKMPVEGWIFCEKGYVKLYHSFSHVQKFDVAVYDGRNPEKLRTVKAKHKGFGYQFEAQEVNRCLQVGEIQSEIITHAFSLALIETLDAARKELGLLYEQDK